jgi:prevent-host-death family protein
MTVTLEHAQSNLADLIDMVGRGENIIITRNDQPIARLIAEKPPARQPRVPGSAKGMIAYMAEDFDAPLTDFKEYME